MGRYLIDTNVVSDYLTASFSSEGINFMDSVIDASPNLSVINQIELLCWKTDETTEQKVKDFINDSVVLNISTDVIGQCVKLRKGKKIKTPDAIVAATALAHDLILISHNTLDFKNIKGLKVIDPYSL